jgi:hypothetical protein
MRDTEEIARQALLPIERPSELKNITPVERLYLAKASGHAPVQQFCYRDCGAGGA